MHFQNHAFVLFIMSRLVINNFGGGDIIMLDVNIIIIIIIKNIGHYSFIIYCLL